MATRDLDYSSPTLAKIRRSERVDLSIISLFSFPFGAVKDVAEAAVGDLVEDKGYGRKLDQV